MPESIFEFNMFRLQKELLFECHAIPKKNEKHDLIFSLFLGIEYTRIIS